MRRFLRNNGLSVALFILFAGSLIGQALTGWRAQAEELRLHELPTIGFLDYLGSGHFISAVFENWESEFLQMAAYVLLTVFLFQKGSPESKKPDEPNPEDELPSPAWGVGCTGTSPSGWSVAEALFAFAQPSPRDAVRLVVLGHCQFNEQKARHLPGPPDQKLTATPVTSAQAVKACERASR
jgi:hypothetical protein